MIPGGNEGLAIVARTTASAAGGGFAAVLGGGKFMNGARTAAYGSMFGQLTKIALNEGIKKAFSVAVDVAKKIWTLPNTAIGITLGLAGYPIGQFLNYVGLMSNPPTIKFTDGNLEFTNSIFTFGLGAITLGNAVNYAPGMNLLWHRPHEFQHVPQGEWTGPLYLPLNLIGQAASVLTYPIWQGNTVVHGPANFMEIGPQATPPRPWPW